MSNPALTPVRAAVFLGVRALAAVLLVVLLAPPCIDAFFRPFHAWYWAQDPQWAPSTVWLPGYTWVYGLAVKLTADTVWTPGLLSAVFFLGTLGWLYRTQAPAHRTMVLVWIGLMPLSWLVAATGLSEALFGLCLVIAVTGLAKYASDGDERILFGAALAMWMAAGTRYDAWPLLVVFCGYGLVAVRRHGTGLRSMLWVGLPMSVPLGWMLLSQSRRGDPLWFLTSVTHDHFGATDPTVFLTGPGGMSVWLAVVGLIVGIRTVREHPGLRVYGAMLAMSWLFVIWVFATGNLPSQLPERMMYPALLLSAPLIGAAWAQWSPGRQLGVVTVLLLSSAAYLISLPNAVPSAERQLARLVGEAYAGGQLAGDEHVVVSGSYPEMTAVLITSGQSDRVHLEDVGRRCPHRVLECDSPCGPPAWRDAIALVLVSGEAVRRDMAGRGWSRVTRVGAYEVFFRHEGAPPLCPVGGSSGGD